MNKALLLGLILLFGMATGFTGYSFHKETVEPVIVSYENMTFELKPGQTLELIPKELAIKYVEVPEPYFVIQKVPVYVDRIKEVEVEKEVIRWRNIYPREFESLEYFKEWYNGQEFHPMLPSPAHTVDCDDYAERVQWMALQQGYSISCHLSPDKRHMFNMVIIGNDIYYFEPQEFKIWKVVEKD